MEGIEVIPKLPQAEAIMEAIIKSSKPLQISRDDGRGFSTPSALLQRLSDSLVPWKWLRWLSFTSVLAAFVARVALLERHFFAAYVLAIYVLNQLMLFLSPASEDDDVRPAPTGVEYRPFVRALSEFRLWIRGFLATSAALAATFVDSLDMDVDGCALALYFAVLFVYTMKQQIFHMIRHGYVPWSGRKPRPKASKAEKGLDV